MRYARIKCTKEIWTWMTVRQLDCGCLHEQAARCRHGPLLSPARTLKGVTEGALPQHGSHQDLKRSQMQDGYKDVQKVSFSVLSLWLFTENTVDGFLSHVIVTLKQTKIYELSWGRYFYASKVTYGKCLMFQAGNYKLFDHNYCM